MLGLVAVLLGLGLDIHKRGKEIPAPLIAPTIIPHTPLKSAHFPALALHLVALDLSQRVLEVVIHDALHELGLLVGIEVDVGVGLLLAAEGQGLSPVSV